MEVWTCSVVEELLAEETIKQSYPQISNPMADLFAIDKIFPLYILTLL